MVLSITDHLKVGDIKGNVQICRELRSVTLRKMYTVSDTIADENHNQLQYRILASRKSLFSPDE